MPYGERARIPEWEFPGNRYEEFKPGAFGSLDGQDLLLNVQHDRGRPIARTDGGGLEFNDSRDALRLSADLPNTTEANDAVENVRAKILRGFSIEFVPDEYLGRQGPDQNTVVHTRARLTDVALVDRPAYHGATAKPRQKHEEPVMDDDKVRAIVEEALAKRAEQPTLDGEVDTAAMATAIAEALGEPMREQIDAALKERDEAQEATKRAEEEAETAKREADEERVRIMADAEERAEIVATVRELLPKDFETKGASRKAILVAAAGEEVPNAGDRSEDYLLAKVETIVERRGKADEQLGRTKIEGGENGDQSWTPHLDNHSRDMVNMIERDRAASRNGAHLN